MTKGFLFLHVAACLLTTASSFSLVVPPTPHTSPVPTRTNVDDPAISIQHLDDIASSSLVSPFRASPSDDKRQTKKGQTAVILNTNARSVKASLHEPLASSILGSSHVYVTSTASEARAAAADIVSNLDQYSLVVPMGGDGTLSSAVSYLRDEIMEQKGYRSTEEAMKDMPVIGYVPLGTGNGVGSVVGISPNSIEGGLFGRRKGRRKRFESVVQQLKDAGDHLASADTTQHEIIEMPMIEVLHDNSATNGANGDSSANHQNNKGDLCFFAGVGFDSLMLDDFKSVKKWSTDTGFMKKTLGSVAGYCVALVCKTLPKSILRGRHKIHVDLVTRDKDALWVDHRRGDFALPAGGEGTSLTLAKTIHGDATAAVTRRKLYSGSAGILAASTSPFYGGGLRLFPFARLTPDKMHLRIGRIHPFRGFLNIPRIFAGSYRETSSNQFGCLDFIGDDFEVEVKSETSHEEHCEHERGYPFQHSGESLGNVERFRLRVVKEKVKFISFLDKRVVDDK